MSTIQQILYRKRGEKVHVSMTDFSPYDDAIAENSCNSFFLLLQYLHEDCDSTFFQFGGFKDQNISGFAERLLMAFACALFIFSKLFIVEG